MDKTALKVFLFISFGMIMLVSVDHIAWAAHSMNEADTSLWSYILSYLFAVAIDLAIAVVSIFLSNQKKVTNKGLGYGFIAFLCGLSWFCNWTYNKENMSHAGVWVSTIHLFTLQISMQKVSPILLGALPIIGVIFSHMIEHFTGDKMTAAELEAQKIEEQQLQEIKEKYKGKSWIEKRKETAIAAISATKEVTNVAKTTFTKQQETERNTDELDFISMGESIKETSETLPGYDEETDEKPERKNRESSQDNTMNLTDENIPSWLAGRGSTISLDEVVKQTKISRKKLNFRVEKKEIRATAGKEKVYKASLIEWLKKEGYLQETATNVPVIPTGNDEETVQQPVQDQEVITEEMASMPELIEA